MEYLISNFADEVAHTIIRDINNGNCSNLCSDVAKAYNVYQQNKQSGNARLYDINDEEDLKHLVKNGMSAAQISKVYNGSLYNETPFFFFDEKDKKVEPIVVNGSLSQKMVDCLYAMALHIIAYPYKHEEYKRLYVSYITNYMINTKQV